MIPVRLPGKAKPKNKYGAKKTVVDGITFASKREAIRYCQLRDLERAGQISSLKLQPRYPLTVNSLHVATYVGDFEYIESKSGRTVTEDSKGVRTRDFINKAKLFHALYGREVLLT
ncbi:DUF1064 domain-containing protein [Mesorhizobium sp. BR1-1-9]|uniref:DUF1064 domain-containing protein n=1 Tax=Mesorhizobium sp. BR1-1-9 TaxID=2876646 RepID=UPI001CD069F9|nr:DUF1064 domain-containing protein [Mesorhizobium sp. BR1-1-9]MBZ9873103.1 DUF1064 domain-containing protein [Mesorhizobium sp. BR1-1-9]